MTLVETDAFFAMFGKERDNSAERNDKIILFVRHFAQQGKNERMKSPLSLLRHKIFLNTF